MNKDELKDWASKYGPQKRRCPVCDNPDAVEAYNFVTKMIADGDAKGMSKNALRTKLNEMFDLDMHKDLFNRHVNDCCGGWPKP
jgi:hypothetical protein